MTAEIFGPFHSSEHFDNDAFSKKMHRARFFVAFRKYVLACFEKLPERLHMDFTFLLYVLIDWREARFQKSFDKVQAEHEQEIEEIVSTVEASDRQLLLQHFTNLVMAISRLN